MYTHYLAEVVAVLRGRCYGYILLPEHVLEGSQCGQQGFHCNQGVLGRVQGPVAPFVLRFNIILRHLRSPPRRVCSAVWRRLQVLSEYLNMSAEVMGWTRAELHLSDPSSYGERHYGWFCHLLWLFGLDFFTSDLRMSILRYKRTAVG